MTTLVHCLDIMSQNATEQCTHCIFRRSDPNREEKNGRYAYNLSVHSANSAFRRAKSRMRLILGAADVSESNLKHMGLKPVSTEELNKLPPHRLSDRLEEIQGRIPLTVDSLPVLSACFDPYQSCVMVQSHVTYGITQNVL